MQISSKMVFVSMNLIVLSMSNNAHSIPVSFSHFKMDSPSKKELFIVGDKHSIGRDKADESAYFDVFQAVIQEKLAQGKKVAVLIEARPEERLTDPRNHSVIGKIENTFENKRSISNLIQSNADVRPAGASTLSAVIEALGNQMLLAKDVKDLRSRISNFLEVNRLQDRQFEGLLTLSFDSIEKVLSRMDDVRNRVSHLIESGKYLQFDAEFKNYLDTVTHYSQQLKERSSRFFTNSEFLSKSLVFAIFEQTDEFFRTHPNLDYTQKKLKVGISLTEVFGEPWLFIRNELANIGFELAIFEVLESNDVIVLFTGSSHEDEIAHFFQNHTEFAMLFQKLNFADSANAERTWGMQLPASAPREMSPLQLEKLLRGEILPPSTHYQSIYTQDPDRCFFCQAPSGSLLQCGQCKEAKYCSKECQVSHWKNGHKKCCKIKTGK